MRQDHARALVARNAKRIRIEAGLTQSQLSARVGKSRQWVSKVERGQIAIDLDAVDMLARALEVNSCELLLEPTREDAIFVLAHTGWVGELDIL